MTKLPTFRVYYIPWPYARKSNVVLLPTFGNPDGWIESESELDDLLWNCSWIHSFYGRAELTGRNCLGKGNKSVIESKAVSVRTGRNDERGVLQSFKI